MGSWFSPVLHYAICEGEVKENLRQDGPRTLPLVEVLHVYGRREEEINGRVEEEERDPTERFKG